MADNTKASLYKKLMEVQSAASVGKTRYNDFGNFYYRTIGDLFAAIKPALKENNAAIYIEDEIVLIGSETVCSKNGDVIRSGDKAYVKATVHFLDCETGEELTTSAYARECQHHNMSDDQSSGSASSYARKYALNAMLLFDEGNDVDSQSGQKPNNTQKPNQSGKKNISWGGKGNQSKPTNAVPPPIPDDVPPPETPPQYLNQTYPQKQQQRQRSPWNGNRATATNEPVDMPPLPEPPPQYQRKGRTA